MLKIERALGNERLLLALTGMRVSEFRKLVSGFDKILYEDLKQRDRQRAVGAGYKGVLSDAQRKLFYIFFLSEGLSDLRSGRFCFRS